MEGVLHLVSFILIYWLEQERAIIVITIWGKRHLQDIKCIVVTPERTNSNMRKYTFKFKAWNSSFFVGVLEYEVYARSYKEAKKQFDNMATYSEYRIELLNDKL